MSMIFILLIIIFNFISQFNSQVFFGTNNGWTGAWNINNGSMIMSLTWEANPAINSAYQSVNCMRFLSSHTIVTGSSDKSLSVWDLSFSPAKNITNFNMHTDVVRCCDKLNDGTVISGGDDQYLYIWNPSNGAVLYSKQYSHSISVLCIKILFDGRIVTGGADNQIKIWPPTLGSPSMTLGGHSQKILVLEQLSNGYLISGSADNNTIVWDLNSGAQMNNFKPAASAVSCIKQLPDNTIAIGVADKNIYRWNITGQNTQTKIGTAMNMISAGPCNAMMLYNSSILVAASGGLDTVLLSITGTSFTFVRSLNLSAPNTVCLENLSFYTTTTISTTTKPTTTTTTKTTTSTTTSTTTTTTTTTTTATTTATTTTTTKKTTSTDDDSHDTHSSTQSSSKTTTSTTKITSSTPFTTLISTTISNELINSSMTLNQLSIIFTSQFTLADISIQEYVAILNSNYDLSDCIVNCSNHGLCKYAGNYSFVCVCQQNYVGKTCQQNQLPCSHNPCLNNATCYQNASTDEYFCECDALYFGANCEYKIDVCQNETCSSNGVCKDILDLATCHCFLNYFGDKCQSETTQQKIIKIVTSTSTFIAVVIICLFYSIVVLNDIATLFIKSKAIVPPKIKLMKPKPYAYVP